MPRYGLDPGPRMNLTGPVVEKVMPTMESVMISPEAAKQHTRQRMMRPAVRRRMNEDVLRTTVDYRPTPVGRRRGGP